MGLHIPTPSIAGNRLRKFFSREQLRQDHVEQDEFLRSRQTDIARQVQAANPTRLQELLGMIDDAQNSGNSGG
jgi:hypothetical protein